MSSQVYETLSSLTLSCYSKLHGNRLPSST
uniref:Uncharacterized protein n=1 Tax=Anguilla anguilla TaxID=7936 RepID=A0A0E9QWU0_ANGAN